MYSQSTEAYFFSVLVISGDPFKQEDIIYDKILTLVLFSLEDGANMICRVIRQSYMAGCKFACKLEQLNRFMIISQF
jgi:hypothetical protein